MVYHVMMDHAIGLGGIPDVRVKALLLFSPTFPLVPADGKFRHCYSSLLYLISSKGSLHICFIVD